VWEPLELRFALLQRRRGQLHARLLRGGHQGYHRMAPVPCPRPGTRQDCLNGVEERPLPVGFEQALAALARLVLTRVRRVIGEPHTSLILTYQRAPPRHTLRTPTMIRRAILQLEDQGGDGRKALTDRLPPRGEPLPETRTGHCGGDAIHTPLLQRREPDAPGRPRRRRLNIVVCRLNAHPPLPPTGAGADLDAGLGVQGEPPDVRGLIREVMHGGNRREARGGFGDCFCG